MNVTLKYFASIREAIGQPSEWVQTQSKTIGELRAELAQRSPAYALAFAPERPMRAALNQVMVDASAPISEGAEIAFFPPVTGG